MKAKKKFLAIIMSAILVLSTPATSAYGHIPIIPLNNVTTEQELRTAIASVGNTDQTATIVGDITITSNILFVSNTTLEIPSGSTLTINSDVFFDVQSTGITIINHGSIINHGTISIFPESNGLINEGSITNNGNLINSAINSINNGTINNNGAMGGSAIAGSGTINSVNGTITPFIGSGTSVNPWQITNIGNWNWIREHHNSPTVLGMLPLPAPSSRYFLLINDIDATALGNNVMIGSNQAGSRFEGNFDGGGNKITVDINMSGENIGLFRAIGVDGSVQNISVSGEITNNGLFVATGALAGLNHGTISSVHSDATVTGRPSTGGLVGINYITGIVEQSFTTGDVIGEFTVGGLVGRNHGIIRDSYTTGNVNSEGSWVGGIVGDNIPTGTITRTFATGVITGSTNVGGIAGWNSPDARITHSIALNGNILATNGPATAGRVWGNYPHESIGYNNFAHIGTQINGAGFSGTPTDRHGQTASPAVNTLDWWNTEGIAWNNVGDSEDSIWLWRDGNVYPPILNGFDGIVQNPRPPETPITETETVIIEIETESETEIETETEIKTETETETESEIKTEIEPETEIKIETETDSASDIITGGNIGGSTGSNNRPIRQTSPVPTVPRPEILVPTPIGEDAPLLQPRPFPFVDVHITDWFYPFVRTVWEQQLFNGVSPTIFLPQGDMTRAMFVQALANMEGINPALYVNNPQRFHDIPSTAWYFGVVEWAASQRLVHGVGGNNFAPNRPITRQEMAVMLYNYTTSRNIALPIRPITNFTDQDEISDWAIVGVTAIQSAGIIAGYPNGSFNPTGTATRAEVATIFSRFLTN